ncbi:MAG: chloride channel protein [Thermoleophilia bacterium]
MLRSRITEHTILLVSVSKWIILSVFVGAIVGTATAIFLKTLGWSKGLSSGHDYYFLLLPFALFLSTLVVKYLAPDAEGHGTEKVIEAIHLHSGKIKAPVVPVKLVATVVTIAAGGSVGKEGPCAQIGAGISSVLASLLRFGDADRRKIVICGISAGFASVFGTPIAAAIFALEVLAIGSISYEVLLPSFIAAIIGFQMTSWFDISYLYHPIQFSPTFSDLLFLKVILAGIFFGICSIILIDVLTFSEYLSSKLKIWKPLKGFIGGLALVALVFIFSSQYLGLGVDTIDATLNGDGISWYAFLAKAVFTSVTLGFGGSGGIVTPIFFIGAAAGSTFAGVLGLNMALFASIGLVSVLAGAANTPIAAGIMSIELFGPEIAPYAVVACAISFLITGHRSVYPSQRLALEKSSSISAELGNTIDNIRPEFKSREKSVSATAVRLLRKMQDHSHGDGGAKQ